MQDLILLNSKTAKMRIVLVGAIFFALVFAWFSIRWQIGNLLAYLTKVSDPNASEIADLAIRWTPGDPSAYSLKAATGEDAAATIHALEEAVRRAPNDYRWRTELGRAYEQDEQLERAEFELKRAVQLAPNYSSARWHLGNYYLRRERTTEALTELKQAAENNPTYRDQVFSLAWDYFNKDGVQMESLVGDRPDLIARLSYFFAARGRAEDSLRSWNRLSDADKAKNVVIARAIGLGLFDQKHFAEALEFSRQFGAETEAVPETITNGSFEKNIGGDDDSRYGWRIVRNEGKFDASSDSKVKRDGNRSLRVTFKGFSKPWLANVFQTVVVEPGKKYRLSFWVRTENLRSPGGPMIEIVNASDDKALVRSQQFPNGTNDWQQINVDFTAPENCRGITIRTIRAFCGEECPITGILWYDDFVISGQ